MKHQPTKKSTRKVVAGGLLAGLLAGSGAGFVLSSTGSAGAANVFPAVVVEDDGTGTTTETGTETGTDEARPEPGTRLAEILAPLVADGTLTQAQADAVVATMLEARPFDGEGPRGHRGHRGEHLATVAEAIGIEEDALREALRDGSTVAEIAAINGVDVQVVIDALVAEAQAHLDEKVAAGDLTEEEAAERLTEATARITDMVNGIRPERPARDV